MIVVVEFVAVGCVQAVPSKLLLFAGFLDFFRLTSSISISMSQRRVDIQTTSEMTPYFTMTIECNLPSIISAITMTVVKITLFNNRVQCSVNIRCEIWADISRYS